MSDVICIRRLTSSDLGWFQAHRDSATSKQRAVNINAPVARRLLNDGAYARGGLELTCRCTFAGAEEVQRRSLWKVGKNWRLGGPKLLGEVYSQVSEDDFFVLRSAAHNDGSAEITFTFVSRSLNPKMYRWLAEMVEEGLDGSMLCAAEGEPLFATLARHLFQPTAELGSGASFPTAAKVTKSAASVKPLPVEDEDEEPRPRTLHERIRSPHILSQMLRVSSDLSAEAQYEFMRVLELLAGQLRSVLLQTGRIVSIERNHTNVWAEVRGKKIAFVDGGVANLAMLGAAPVAIRVGGYIVEPGRIDDEREQFVMAKHLIDELYSPPQRGVYEGLFPDPGALRDAARISVETAGAVRLLSEMPDIRFLFPRCAGKSSVAIYRCDGGGARCRSISQFFSFCARYPAAWRKFQPE